MFDSVFAIIAVVLFSLGLSVFLIFETGEVITDLMLLFAGGSLSSAWIAFSHWRYGVFGIE